MPLLFQIQFTSESYLWLLACMGLGISYAFLLYKPSGHLHKTLRYFLFALRSIAISTIAFLLFSPLVKTINRTVEKPLIILAQDNSASILLSKTKDFNWRKYNNQLKKLEKDLSADYELRTFNFAEKIKSGLDVKYDGSLTDISSVFKLIDDQFSNRNIGAVIIGTDGIYNRGSNPQYESKNLKAPIYAIALGDTIAKRDLLITNVNYNNIAYLGNQFQIGVSIEAYQSEGSTSMLTVSSESDVLLSKPVSINSNEFRQTILLNLPAEKKGVQSYKIKLAALSNELSLINNAQTIFVEVIDGRKNVLIIANAPHPDISAIRQSIEINKNYSVKVRMGQEATPAEIQEAGLLILHQVPSISNNAMDVLKLGAAKPILYVLGAQSNIPAFSASQSLVSLNSSGMMQEATAAIKTDFYAFTLSENSRTKISNFGPLLTPFGNYGLKGPSSLLMNQQIGKLQTEKPLLLFGEDVQRRIAVLAGEGIWRWRLEDFQENASHEAIDELITKTVQYLVSADDKRKFRVYASKNTFDENEHVILNAELYNDAFELVNTPDVNISLKNKNGKSYSFVFSRTLNSYQLDAGELVAGEHNYTAVTALGSVKHQAEGQFIVSRQDSEYKQSIANHQLLFTIAKQNGGQMLFPAQLDELPALIKANEQVKSVFYENPKYSELIDLKLLFFMILALLSLEWLSRKRNGEI
ncbi:hypothetical protein [Daejeonella sp.]|uniref:hypothetical protein n=1 Tax=Daejeonella sp. TaxID=2805397 RepID=UPI00272EFDE4|nr:hypothetical protein [Daejeonella sp.]MDP2412369.1 hypothetical protein [Daejeonella sp.]